MSRPVSIAMVLLLLRAAGGALPENPTVPQSMGVNIHFTDPHPHEMDMLAAAGFKWVRMDFAWARTEPRKADYDFSAYNRLMTALDEKEIHALFILDYSNPRYDEGLSPFTDEGREAFAVWAGAAVDHFQGRGIIWEMYNEPNGGFWKPKVDADAYAKLALAVGKAIHDTAPDETYIGPATSLIDLPFLETCFKAGLLQYWSAVSVHPYRQSEPETVAAEYKKLRALIDQYAPPGKVIPIVSGEWGYSELFRNQNEVNQGKTLAREFLINFANHIPLSIWYDWHDDGLDPKNSEHHFGIVHYGIRDSGPDLYDPKFAYLAAKTLSSTFAGFRFDKRLTVGTPGDYVLSFTDGKSQKLAAWTTSAYPRGVSIPVTGSFKVISHTGDSLPEQTATVGGLHLTLTDSPVYLTPAAGNTTAPAPAAPPSRPPTSIPTTQK